MELPRLFVPSHPGVPLDAAGEARALFALDALQLQCPGRPAATYVVAAERMGQLHLVPVEPRHAMAAPLQQQLAHHELVRASPLRSLVAGEVFAMDVQAMDSSVEAPGLNDPVVLTGWLHGPFPSVGAAQRVQGRLTVTRADVLAGLMMCRQHAFHSHAFSRSARVHHVLLPADPPAAATHDTRAVLCYPMMPGELGLDHVANDELLSDIIHGLLQALRTELAAEDPAHPLVNTVLPVPSRPALIRQLEADGWRVEGDEAHPPRKGGGGLLQRLAVAISGKSVRLPPEATVDQFIDLARAALDALPAAARSRTRAFEEAIHGRGVSHVLHTTWKPRDPTPRPPDPPLVPPRSPTPQLPRRKTDKPDWMADFSSTPPRPATSSSAPRPARKPAPSAPAAPGQGSSGKPDWMKDFE